MAIQGRRGVGLPMAATSRPMVEAPADVAALVALLCEIRDEQRAQRTLIEEHLARRTRTLTRRDRERLARLLPAIAGVFGSTIFVVREAFEHAAPALRIVLAGESAKGIGRLFRRGADVPCEGFVVRDQGSELNCTLWQIFRVVD